MVNTGLFGEVFGPGTPSCSWRAPSWSECLLKQSQLSDKTETLVVWVSMQYCIFYTTLCKQKLGKRMTWNKEDFCFLDATEIFGGILLQWFIKFWALWLEICMCISSRDINFWFFLWVSLSYLLRQVNHIYCV